MELRQLEVFLAVVDEQHFTRAAARCSMSQSALSATIRTLERELDTSLFHRTTRRVTLTEAGAALAVEARRTLDAAQAALAAVRATRDVVQGTVRIGGLRTHGRYDQVGLVAAYRDRYPDVYVRYEHGSSPELIGHVADARLDVAFVTLMDRLPKGLPYLELLTDPMGIAVPADDPLATRSAVGLDDLRDRPLIGAQPGSLTQVLADRAQSRDEHRLRLEATDAATMVDFVAHGVGIALVPPHLVAAHPSLRWVPLSDPTICWRFGLITRPEGDQTRAAEAFVEVVRETL